MKTPRSRTRAALHASAAFLLATLPVATRAQETPAAPPAPAKTQAQSAPTERRPAPPAAPDASRAARTATPPLTGRVVGEAGEPIPGVTVYAAPRARGSNMRSPHIAMADDGGNFQFAGLEPGLYLLNATVPGYISETDPLTGRPGSTYRPGDSATLRLTRGSVVTGSVTDQQGGPLVGLGVRASRVRDLDGRPQPLHVGEDRTDDRGVYRIYGLQPGVYVVSAGGLSTSGFGAVTPYGEDVPTFYPSGTRDTAAEVILRGGQETAGIDIRYREELGRRVTGTVEFPAGTQPGEYGASILLRFASTSMMAGSGWLSPNSPERSFSIEGVGDGDYDLQAQSGGREGAGLSSAPQRVSVRGADVTGVRLTLMPLASASGTLRIEPAAEAERAREACKSARATQLPQETLVTAVPERAHGAAANRPLSRLAAPQETTPDEAGDFVLRGLEPGRYRLSFRLFDEALYVRSVQLPAPGPAGPGANAATPRDLFELKAGQQLTGLGVRLTEGAASLSGRVEPAEGAAPPPYAQTRVHLVPQERERAADPLRYHETWTAADGTFSFRNLAPGRYLLLARAEPPAADPAPRAAAWDADSRARLRREAESAETPVELQPCQRTADFVLRFPSK